MRRFARFVAPGLGALAVSAPLILAAAAAAQMREFTGRIDEVSAVVMIVDNRMGDKVSFVRVDETVVEGEKDSWAELKRADWVSVSWKFVDKPRKAHVVRVLPPKADDE
jgi:hypothetical protein